jgi:hypothetical protein
LDARPCLPAILALALASGFGCGAAPAASSEARAAPIDQAAVDVLVREACPRLLARTFPLADESDRETTGKAWVRRCSAEKIGAELALEVDVLGWQWVGAGSWGFDVREYVYFRASVRARLRAAVLVEGTRPKLRVWSESAPDLDVRALGSVSARADGPAASLLGVAFGVFGHGPNDLATSALRRGVAEKMRSQARRGLEIALEDAAPPDAPGAVLLRDAQRLFPGGAMISGSFPPNVATTLRYDVATPGKALVRALCVDAAAPLVDAVLEGGSREASPPSDVLVVEGHGEVPLEARACPWVLVTGVSTDTSVGATFELVRRVRAPGVAERRPASRRWVEATLLAYHVDSRRAPLLGFTLRSGAMASSFGKPLTRSESTSVWLAAPPVEIDDAPMTIEVREWKPRRHSFWDAEATYDQTMLGEAKIAPVPGQKHGRYRAEVKRGGTSIGWVDIALDLTEVE